MGQIEKDIKVKFERIQNLKDEKADTKDEQKTESSWIFWTKTTTISKQEERDSIQRKIDTETYLLKELK